jgi:hypothetical protein
MHTQNRQARPIRGDLGQHIAQTPSLGEVRLRQIEAFVNDAARRESMRPGQVSNHPQPVEADTPSQPKQQSAQPRRPL